MQARKGGDKELYDCEEQVNEQLKVTQMVFGVLGIIVEEEKFREIKLNNNFMYDLQFLYLHNYRNLKGEYLNER
ncbi:hypothetical protein [Peribacillus frigoritolerans]|uniref:Uncharacterized protein n=1 Tax=Peribacillus castrilensis TaxID=2897690 RepID=A0AAW9NK64_9BACI|nr:hypothetical protein [Peribacillus castrilensis]